VGFSALVLVAALGIACGAGGASNGPRSGPLKVVAAENMWGSIAAQLGGSHVQVTNLINSPSADPHDYEATPADGRAVAGADYFLANGLGYDPWAAKLASANKSSRRLDASVQQMLGLKDGENPHRWYAPGDVLKVVDRIAADYAKLDPANAAAYEQQRAAFASTALQQYTEVASQIRQRYAGTPIAATESIAAPLVASLGLKLLTPDSFLNAVSEGNDPSARDVTAFNAQITSRQIKVLLFNTQNATPDVQRLVDAAKAQGIPVVGLTETPDPPTQRFQDWQTAQLQEIAKALAR
jgi:zinc/manganese transport system substrate-binding protein